MDSPINMGLPKTLFWDANIEQLDVRKDAFFIIKRIVLHGGQSERNIMYQLYSNTEILDVITQSREIDQHLKLVYQKALSN